MRLLLISILVLVFQNSYSLAPKIFNFQILNSNTNRIYFESTEPITASNAVGFIVTGNSINSIYINASNLTGHYFTVDTAFNFWDNNTIRYEGGSDFQNMSGDSLYPFTLVYIENSISEPISSQNYYVSISGNDNNSGLTPADAWRTINKAAQTVTAGSSVWVKAGNYGAENVVVANHGTPTNPIKFIGYKNSPGDNPTLTRSQTTVFSSSEMPLLSYSSQSGNAIQARKNNIIIRNFQIDGYRLGIDGRYANNSISDNIYCKNNYIGVSYWGSPYISKTNRILNSYSLNNAQDGFLMVGERHLIDNCYAASLGTPNMDYYIVIVGSPQGEGEHIIRNCKVVRDPQDTHGGHGIDLKQQPGSSDVRLIYNSLIENCELHFVGQAISLRHHTVKYNVVRNVQAYGNYNVGNLITFRDGASYNIVENCYAENTYSAFRFTMNIGEDLGRQEGGNNNVIKNTIVNKSKYVIIDGGINSEMAYKSKNNQFLNCTFYDRGYQFYSGTYSYGFDSTNSFTNCVFSDTDPDITGIYNATYNYCNAYNTFTITGGVGNISVNPQFVNATAGDFHLQSTSPLINAGLTLSNVKYDYEGTERPNTGGYDMGAFEYGVTPCQSNIDSIVSVIEKGDSVLFSNQHLKTSGIYYDTLMNQGGCDSIVKLNLKVNNLHTICKNNPNIVIDGIEDLDWDLLDSAGILNVAGNNLPPSSSDLSGYYKMFWDDSNMYLLVKVYDNIVVTPDNGSSYWHDDGIAIFIDGGNENSTSFDSNDAVIGITVGSNDIYKNYSLHTQNNIIKHESTTSFGYTMEVKIKLSSVGINPNIIDKIGFELYINDDDDGGSRDYRITWNDQTTQSLTNPLFFGAIKMSSDSCDLYYTTTAFEGEKTHNNFNVFPNPSTGNFTLDFGENSNKVYAIKIVNAIGEIVYINEKVVGNQTISIKNKGVYFVSFFNENKNIETSRIIIK